MQDPTRQDSQIDVAPFPPSAASLRPGGRVQSCMLRGNRAGGVNTTCIYVLTDGCV